MSVNKIGFIAKYLGHSMESFNYLRHRIKTVVTETEKS
jgi:hypothetical protein